MMNHHERYDEIDLLRTLAVLGMIVYHFVYDLWSFTETAIDPFSGAWLVLARATAILFLLLVGMSFAISWDRAKARGLHGWALYKKYLKRGIGVLLCGLLISVATYLMDAETYVRFGILQLIGTSILLLPLLTRFREWNAAIGAAIIVVGMFLGQPGHWLLLPFNFFPADFRSVDYFPLLPWFGVVLLGYAAGHALYVRGLLTGHLSLPAWLTLPGRFALWIYLLHQPILLGILTLAVRKP